MKLLYKQHILNELIHTGNFDGFFMSFWKQSLIDYMVSLGFPKSKDYYLNYQALMQLDDNKYCGVIEDGQPIDGIDYYVVDTNSNEIYWFKSAGDAVYFSTEGAETMYRPQDHDAYASVFLENTRNRINGWLWITANDFDYIEVAKTMTIITCVEMKKNFASIEEAAQWVVNNGKAADVTRAIRGITNNLNGKSQRSYGFT